jgi:membrane fusion protein (multidrug efflux system)
VAVAEVEIGDASSYYTSTATLEAEHHAQLLARTTGVVREIAREEGDRVKAGDLLLRLEDDEARQRLEQADANLAMAQAEHARRTRMRDGGLLSDEEFETTENTLRIREAERELAKLQFDFTRVRSPLDGRVVRRLVDLGQNVTPGTPLFEVMDVEPLLARVHIPAKRMGFVEVGQDITISLETTDETLHGRVSLVSPIVDPTTGTVKVTAEIDDYPETTRPGDFAQVSIVTERHEATRLVPSVAVFEEQGRDVLYVVEDGKAARRIVETGFVDGDLTEIVDGLSPEALVVVRGQRQLRDGAEVEVLEGPPHVMAALAVAEPESSAEASSAEAADEKSDAAPAPAQGT